MGQNHLFRGQTSDVYAVMCRTGESGANGISCLLVEAGLRVYLSEQKRKNGLNTQHTAAVHFDNCLVPIDNMVGNEGDGFKIAMAGWMEGE